MWNFGKKSGKLFPSKIIIYFTVYNRALHVLSVYNYNSFSYLPQLTMQI